MMSDPILPHKSSLTPVSAPKSSLLFEKERLLKEIQRLETLNTRLINRNGTLTDALTEIAELGQPEPSPSPRLSWDIAKQALSTGAGMNNIERAIERLMLRRTTFEPDGQLYADTTVAIAALREVERLRAWWPGAFDRREAAAALDAKLAELFEEQE